MRVFRDPQSLAGFDVLSPVADSRSRLFARKVFARKANFGRRRPSSCRRVAAPDPESCLKIGRDARRQTRRDAPFPARMESTNLDRLGNRPHPAHRPRIEGCKPSAESRLCYRPADSVASSRELGICTRGHVSSCSQTNPGGAVQTSPQRREFQFSPPPRSPRQRIPAGHALKGMLWWQTTAKPPPLPVCRIREAVHSMLRPGTPSPPCPASASGAARTGSQKSAHRPNSASDDQFRLHRRRVASLYR